MNKSIAFRVDGSSYIGAGHVVRCLTLARALSDIGFHIHFFTIGYEDYILRLIKEKSFELSVLPDIGIECLSDNQPVSESKQILDVENCLSYIEFMSVFEFVIIDNYRFGSSWEIGFSKFAKRIVVLDDLSNRPHKCDFLIDQTYGVTMSNYRNLLDENCRLLSGTEYALLRPEFLAYVETSKLKRKNTEKVNSILICFGGGEFTEHIKASLKALDKINFNGEVNVVISKSNDNLTSYISISNFSFSLNVNVDVKDMPLAILNSDISIGAFGTMSWERCCLGLPSLSMILSLNQEFIAKQMEKNNLAISCNLENISERLNLLMEDMTVTNLWRGISLKSYAACDARGVSRVIKELSL